VTVSFDPVDVSLGSFNYLCVLIVAYTEANCYRRAIPFGTLSRWGPRCGESAIMSHRRAIQFFIVSPFTCYFTRTHYSMAFVKKALWCGASQKHVRVFGVLLFLLLEMPSAAVEPFQRNNVTTPESAPTLAPGQVIAGRPPKGWSHLIIQSYPRACLGDVKEISPTYVKMASLVSTSIVANVVRSEGVQGLVYQLGNVATGSTIDIQGQQTVVTSKTYKKLGARLNMLEQVLLREFDKRAEMVTLVARSGTMAVVDAPVSFHWAGKNQRMTLRYAVLVDGATGQLAPLVWLIDGDSPKKAGQVVSNVEWLPPNHVEDSQLYVDKEETLLTLPTEDAFAIVRVPTGGHSIEPDEALKPLMGQPRLTAASARQLELSLRRMLAVSSERPAPRGTATPVPVGRRR